MLASAVLALVASAVDARTALIVLEAEGLKTNELDQLTHAIASEMERSGRPPMPAPAGRGCQIEECFERLRSEGAADAVFLSVFAGPKHIFVTTERRSTSAAPRRAEVKLPREAEAWPPLVEELVLTLFPEPVAIAPIDSNRDSAASSETSDAPGLSAAPSDARIAPPSRGPVGAESSGRGEAAAWIAGAAVVIGGGALALAIAGSTGDAALERRAVLTELEFRPIAPSSDLHVAAGIAVATSAALLALAAVLAL